MFKKFDVLWEEITAEEIREVRMKNSYYDDILGCDVVFSGSDLRWWLVGFSPLNKIPQEAAWPQSRSERYGEERNFLIPLEVEPRVWDIPPVLTELPLVHKNQLFCAPCWLQLQGARWTQLVPLRLWYIPKYTASRLKDHHLNILGHEHTKLGI